LFILLLANDRQTLMLGNSPNGIQLRRARSPDAAKGCQDDAAEQMKAQFRFDIKQFLEKLHAHCQKQNARERRDEATRELRERARRHFALMQAWEEPPRALSEPLSIGSIHAQLKEMQDGRSRDLREISMLALSEPCSRISMPATVAPLRVPGEVPSETKGKPKQKPRAEPVLRHEQEQAREECCGISTVADMAPLHASNKVISKTRDAACWRMVPSPLPESTRTLLVRNVPLTCTQGDILAEWPPNGAYDYLRVPYNVSKKIPLGHAFINFVTYEGAVAFYEKWHGGFLSQHDSKHPLDVVAAHIQGTGPNLTRIKKAEVHKLAEVGFLPVLLDGKRQLGTQEVLQEWRRVCSQSQSGPGMRRFQ